MEECAWELDPWPSAVYTGQGGMGNHGEADAHSPWSFSPVSYMSVGDTPQR